MDCVNIKNTLLSTLKSAPNANSSTSLYAIVDASRSPMTIPASLQAMSDNVECLYRGSALEEFGDDTAWVVQLAEDESTFDWLISNGFGKRWTIFLSTSQPLQRLVRHLKKFTMVNDGEGTNHFFRLYDPMVLRQYLPVFNEAQLSSFFQEIDVIACENDLRPRELLSFSVRDAELQRTSIHLPTPD